MPRQFRTRWKNVATLICKLLSPSATGKTALAGISRYAPGQFTFQSTGLAWAAATQTDCRSCHRDASPAAVSERRHTAYQRWEMADALVRDRATDRGCAA